MRASPAFLVVIVALIAAIELGIRLIDDPSVIEVLSSRLGQIADLAAGFELQ